MPLSIFAVELVSDQLLLLAPILVFAAILITKVGVKLGAPSLLLFLILGMLVGSEGLGLRFDEYEMSETIGHLAITVILFTGGFETILSETKPVMRRGLLLSTVGVVLTMTLTGLFVMWRADSLGIATSIVSCLLIGAVLSSTDSTSVFSVLHGRKLRLRNNLAPLLELESGSNDPMAFLLTILLVNIITKPELRVDGVWPLFANTTFIVLMQIVVGFAVGLGIGFAAKWALSKIKLDNNALMGILIMSTGFFANGLASLLHGNGLMAIYITAVIISNKADIPQKKDITKFFDGITWIMQLAMFLLLGLLARPSHLWPVAGTAILIAIFIIFVARPVSVFITLAPFRKMKFKEKLFVSWVGLKGAGPILFALYPLTHGVEGSEAIFNVVFFVALLSLLLQGMSLVSVAKWLDLSYPEDPEVQSFGLELPEEMGMLRDHTIRAEDLEGGKTLRELHLPHGIRVFMVKRDGRFLVPHGSMELKEDDHLLIVMGESDD